MTRFLVRSVPFRKQFLKGMMISSFLVAMWVKEPGPGVSSPALSLFMNLESAPCWSQE